HELPLIVGVDQPHEVAEHDAMPMTETRARQDHGGKARVIEVDGEAARDQLGLSRREQQRGGDAGTQVEAGGTVPGVRRQGKFAADACVENPHLECAAGGGGGAQASAVPRLRAPLRAASSCAISATRPRARVSLPARGSSWRALRVNTISWLSSQSEALSWPTSLSA